MKKSIFYFILIITFVNESFSQCQGWTSGGPTVSPSTSWQTQLGGVYDFYSVPDKDVYRFYAQVGRVYTFKTGCGDGATTDFDTQIKIYNEACSNVLFVDNDNCSNGGDEATWTASASGYTYLVITSSSITNGTYYLAYKYTECTLPSSPTGVSASDGNFCDKVEIIWNSVAGATDYSVYRGTTLLIENTTSLAYTDLSAAGATSTYYVYANNSCGTSTASGSDSGYKLSVTSAPTGVNASDGTFCDKVLITWNSVSGATSYDVYRNSTFLANVSTVTYSDLTAPTTSTLYNVYAKNLCGNSTAGSNSGYRSTGLSAPANVTASDGTQCDEVVITWVSVSGATSYDVYRASTFLANTSENSYEDLEGNVTSTAYNIYAKDDGACTSQAGTDNGYLKTIPDAPLLVSATDGECDEVVITWNSVSGATGYEIYKNSVLIGTNTTSTTFYDEGSSTPTEYGIKAINSCGASAMSVDIGFVGRPSAPTGVTASDGTYCDKVVITWNNVTFATSYDVYRGSTLIGNVTTTTYNDNNSTAASTSYKVKAKNECGSSAEASDNGYRNSAPTAPTGVSASDGTYCDKVVITWNSVSGATSYDVYRGSTLLGNVTTTTYNDNNSTAASTSYKVKAKNECGSSAEASDNGYRNSVPTAPTGVSASDGTYCDKVVITWNSVSGATSYDVFLESTLIGNVTSTTFTDFTAMASSSIYMIKAKNTCGSSVGSSDEGHTCVLSNFESSVKTNAEVFPNPNNGIFAVKIQNPYIGKVNLKIFTTTGTLVQFESFEKYNYEMVYEMKSEVKTKGIYILEIKMHSEYIRSLIYIE